jgi:hypothetical protein
MFFATIAALSDRNINPIELILQSVSAIEAKSKRAVVLSLRRIPSQSQAKTSASSTKRIGARLADVLLKGDNADAVPLSRCRHVVI